MRFVLLQTPLKQDIGKGEHNYFVELSGAFRFRDSIQSAFESINEVFNLIQETNPNLA
jgi:hypothetical protein